MHLQKVRMQSAPPSHDIRDKVGRRAFGNWSVGNGSSPQPSPVRKMPTMDENTPPPSPVRKMSDVENTPPPSPVRKMSDVEKKS